MIPEQALEHGAQISGRRKVALLEDVVTTGGSSLKAVESLKEAGAEVVGIVALVDRQEGGAETIRAAGLPLVTIATKSDFIP